MIPVARPFGFAQGRLFSQSARKRMGLPAAKQLPVSWERVLASIYPRVW
jgi:hypothetical protein